MNPLNRLHRTAVACAQSTHADGRGWCSSCPDGGWDGPEPYHFRSAAYELRRPLTRSELEEFAELFMTALEQLPAIDCAEHQRQQASA